MITYDRAGFFIIEVGPHWVLTRNLERANSWLRYLRARVWAEQDTPRTAPLLVN